MRDPERHPSSPSRARRFWTEPLLHFAVLGAGIYALYAFAGRHPTDERAPIVITPRFVEGLRQDHARRTGRAPDPATEKALVDDFVREEALVREGRRLGLDRGDPIVRRRLVQKMQFWLEGTVEVPEPTDAELRDYLAAHPDRWRRPPKVAFTHVFFARDGREDPKRDAERVLARIRAGSVSEAEAPERGDPFVLGSRMALRPVAKVAGTFGEQFANRVADLPLDRWAGPIESGVGWHLVRVTAREAGAMPALDEVRSRVKAAVIESRRKEAVRAAEDRILAEYPVEHRKEEDPAP